MCEGCGCNIPDSVYMPHAATIISQKHLTPEHSLLRLSFDTNGKTFLPGQFILASLPGYGEAPISIASSLQNNNEFEIVVHGVGKVTTALCQLRTNDTIGFRGPFGNSFPLDDFFGNDILLIAEDMGICAIRSAIYYIANNRTNFKTVTVFISTTESSQELYAEERSMWQSEFAITIYENKKPLQPQLLDKRVSTIDSFFPTTVYKVVSNSTKTIIVVPNLTHTYLLPHLKNLGIAEKNIFVSLERRMKCGIGKCGHCQVDGLHVCMDGPVFCLDKISHLLEAL